MLTDDREHRILDLVRWRQRDFIVILENIHDPHNLGAIVRSCDAAGVGEIHVIYSKEGENSIEKYVGKRASRGAAKWVDVSFYTSAAKCFEVVRSKVDHVYATHLSEAAQSLYHMDLTASFALVLGNEKDGISAEVLAMCDANIVIPMYGMVQSINVSNACAIILFEAMRQRIINGNYDRELNLEDTSTNTLLQSYLARTRPRIASADKNFIKGWIDKLP